MEYIGLSRSCLVLNHVLKCIALLVVVIVITQELEGHGEERLEVLEQLEEDDGEEVGPQEGLHEGLAGGGGKGGYSWGPIQ